MKSNRSMPKSVVIPVLAYENVQEAVDWLCKVFQFSLRLKIGDHRAQLNVAEGSIVVNKLNSLEISGTKSHSIMVRIEDLQNHYEHVKRNGAKIISEPQNYPYGERQYTVEDIGRHIWTFSETFNDSNPEDWGGLSLNLQ